MWGGGGNRRRTCLHALLRCSSTCLLPCVPPCVRALPLCQLPLPHLMPGLLARDVWKRVAPSLSMPPTDKAANSPSHATTAAAARPTLPGEISASTRSRRSRRWSTACQVSSACLLPAARWFARWLGAAKRHSPACQPCAARASVHRCCRPTPPPSPRPRPHRAARVGRAPPLFPYCRILVNHNYRTMYLKVGTALH